MYKIIKKVEKASDVSPKKRKHGFTVTSLISHSSLHVQSTRYRAIPRYLSQPPTMPILPPI